MMSFKEQQPQPQDVISQTPFIISSKYIDPYEPHNPQPSTKYKFTGFKLLAAFSSVVLSQFLVSKTIVYRIFNNLYQKSSKTEDKKIWINRQIKHLLKTMIKYNTMVFGAKVLLDDYYAETLRKNQAYYQSNSALHYKIGAMVGLIAYVASISISEFQTIKTMNKISPGFGVVKEPQSRWKILSQTSRQFLSLQALKRMINNFNFVSLSGIVLYRTIYFGVYEKVISKYKGPLSEYIIAPIVCSSFSLIITPLDEVKYLQMTSHKSKKFYQIMLQKGLKLWNLSGEKISVTISKQSLSMAFFVAGQNLCKFLIDKKTSHY